MRLLLDTHALLWWVAGDERMPISAREAIDAATETFASAVSAMEIATKFRIGKLPEGRLLAGDFEVQLLAHGFSSLSLTARHAQFAGNLLIANKDPFDRMLIAQSIIEGIPLVSNEVGFDHFGVSRVW
ncbi:type II toxin-antitoxin system VapC family toxin [Glacieibacterium megasporae]|uniref:type II toxin-antitoxin system VapC family toxin n=1 Tax=Glacieibacterium megasporae TaxID=2835787 RepID=UPI001C1E2B56|nr:type II toxin-antitoxin system VapC family toxin [Polymorphobacter megasporae]UAJ09586.1 type II toxin-antitoxin system VapC family toxin [Polymorphobacter megasporae]